LQFPEKFTKHPPPPIVSEIFISHVSFSSTFDLFSKFYDFNLKLFSQATSVIYKVFSVLLIYEAHSVLFFVQVKVVEYRSIHYLFT
jgi:hypothetical protein